MRKIPRADYLGLKLPGLTKVPRMEDYPGWFRYIMAKPWTWKWRQDYPDRIVKGSYEGSLEDNFDVLYKNLTIFLNFDIGKSFSTDLRFSKISGKCSIKSNFNSLS